MARRVFVTVTILVGLLIVPAGANGPGGYFVANDPDLVYQISTLGRLQQGDYQGRIPLTAMMRNGNFGIGTFHGIEGEMIILDGQVWQGDVAGKVRLVEEDELSPFATVTDFQSDAAVPLTDCSNLREAEKKLVAGIADRNSIHGIMIRGTFPQVTYRSVPEQQEPFPPLAQVIAQQKTFQRQQVSGTVLGFWFPDDLGTVQAPGFHLHFISDDRLSAGHLLDLAIGDEVAQIDVCKGLYVDLSGLQPAATRQQMLYAQAVDYLLLNRYRLTSRPEVQLTERDAKLQWREGKVLMATLTPYSDSYPPGQEIKTTWGTTWVVPEYQLNEFANKSQLKGTELQHRLEKYLGMPVSDRKKSIVTIWVDPQELYRPAREPAPAMDAAQAGLPADQGSSYYTWFAKNIAGSYFAGSDYPWTRLGYTFDWGNPSDFQGADEFVVEKNATVLVERVRPLE